MTPAPRLCWSATCQGSRISASFTQHLCLPMYAYYSDSLRHVLQPARRLATCTTHLSLMLSPNGRTKTLCTTIQYDYFKSFSLNYEVNIPVCERSAKPDSHFEQRERHGSYPTRISLPLQPGALQASGLPKTNRNMERAQCSKHLAVFPANLRRHDMTLITKNPCEITIQLSPRSSSSTPAITSKKGRIGPGKSWWSCSICRIQTSSYHAFHHPLLVQLATISRNVLST